MSMKMNPLVEKLMKHRQDVKIILDERLSHSEKQRRLDDACASMQEAAMALAGIQHSLELIEERLNS